MKSFRFGLFAGAAALLLAGCSTAVSPEKAAQVDPAKTGLVLATLHRTGEKYTRVEFMLHRMDGRESSFTNMAIDSTKGLTLIEVPVGRYEIADWAVAGDAKLTALDAPNARQKFEFDVEPGQVTYLGHFEVAVKPVAYTSSRWGSPPVRPILEDRSTETIETFHQQYPALAAVPVHSVAPERATLIPASKKGYARFPLPNPYAEQDMALMQPMPTGPKWP